MELEKRRIDNVTFANLVDEAIKRIPQLTKEWTNYNPSDPGITFIELFAWLAEMQMFYMDQVTERHLLKYLRLLGTQPRPALPASVQVTFFSSDKDSFLVAAGQQVGAKTEDGTVVVFETIDDVTYVSTKLTKIFAPILQDDQCQTTYQSINLENNSAAKYFWAFGENPPAEGQTSFYLGFSKPFPSQGNISLAINLYEDDLPPVGSHDEEFEIIPSANVLWEYSTSQTNVWSPLKVTDDSTLALARSGFLKFIGPTDMASTKFTLDGVPEVEQQFWLRCTLKEGIHEIPPRIQSIRSNTVNAIQMKKCTGFAEQQISLINELPDQAFKLVNAAIVPRKLVVKVKEGEKWIQWSFVESFDGSNCSDRHFTFKIEFDSDTGQPRGEILFGDGKKGMQPPKASDNIKVISYIYDKPAEQDIFSFTGNDAKFILRTVPLILKDALVFTAGDPALWLAREDFDASKPEDRHFTIDYTKGELQLGNGVCGRISSGQNLVAAVYYCTMAQNGNVKATTINQVIGYSGAGTDLTVTNFEDAMGGAEAESLEAATIRAQLDLKKTYKAVTLADFEELAKCTPGLRLVRAEASWNKELQNSNEPVKVIVIPYRLHGSTAKLSPTSAGFKKTVCLHLDMHRLLTTPIQVVDPKYVEVTVQATVKAKSLA